MMMMHLDEVGNLSPRQLVSNRGVILTIIVIFIPRKASVKLYLVRSISDPQIFLMTPLFHLHKPITNPAVQAVGIAHYSDLHDSPSFHNQLLLSHLPGSWSDEPRRPTHLT